MKLADLELLRCPSCRSTLAIDAPNADVGDLIEEGALFCEDCGTRYEITSGIPRFVSSKNYADSFGIEWERRSQVLHDKNWQRMYRTRFFATTDFETDLSGQEILEVGCGSGGFTGIALSTGARIHSFDLSNAVEVCKDNHRSAFDSGRLSLFQANIYKIPFALGTFDKIFCLGVLQHTPDPKGAYLNLGRFLKPGGTLAVDCYRKQQFPHMTRFHAIKHALRFVTKHIPPRILFPVVSGTLTVLYNIKAMLSKVPRIGERLQRVIPIGELQRFDWTPAQMKEMKSMNVFDMLSPRYDNPQTVKEVYSWVLEAGLEPLKCTVGYNGVNSTARRSSPNRETG